jgi:TolB-like protein
VRVYTLRTEAGADLALSCEPPAVSLPSLAAPRLSIVVLPFANLSNDPEQQYFADGITEDLTTDLSRLANMLVISRNTAFTYRNRPIYTKQIGRELGVRYVLEGSVRRAGNQLRVSAQLIDAATDAYLWADRFDCDTGDMFALQNEITSRRLAGGHDHATRPKAAAAHPYRRGHRQGRAPQGRGAPHTTLEGRRARRSSRHRTSLPSETARLETAVCLGDLIEGDPLGDARPDVARF